MSHTFEIPIELVVDLDMDETVDPEYIRRRFLETPPERRSEFLDEFGGWAKWDAHDNSCDTAKGFRTCQELIQNLSTGRLNYSTWDDVPRLYEDAELVEFADAVTFEIVDGQPRAYLVAEYVFQALLGLVLIERCAGRINGICRRCGQLFAKRAGKLFCNDICAHAAAVKIGRQKRQARKVTFSAMEIRKLQPTARKLWSRDPRLKRIVADKVNASFRALGERLKITPNYLTLHEEETQAEV